jgi:DNA-binding PadR family transcriptional regulator
MSDLILLAALLEGPQHGYALKKLAGLLFGQEDMHNNLVYPLLRRFVENSWVVKRTTEGQRGQKRDLYALTSKGKLELLRRLSRFTLKEAPSENEFRVRVGLFSMLDRNVRERILAERDRFLAQRQGRLESIETGMAAMNADDWGYSVLHFYLSQVRAERKWIGSLKRGAAQRRKGKNRIVEL